jgi:hypothetical protein
MLDFFFESWEFWRDWYFGKGWVKLLWRLDFLLRTIEAKTPFIKFILYFLLFFNLKPFRSFLASRSLGFIN